MKNVVNKPIDSTIQPAAGVAIDRSREVLQTMDKEPRDHLTCVRVFDDFYRCNWWSPGALPGRESSFEGLEVSTYRIRKSHFVKAVIRDGQLFIEDATANKSPMVE